MYSPLYFPLALIKIGREKDRKDSIFQDQKFGLEKKTIILKDFN